AGFTIHRNLRECGNVAALLATGGDAESLPLRALLPRPTKGLRSRLEHRAHPPTHSLPPPPGAPRACADPQDCADETPAGPWMLRARAYPCAFLARNGWRLPQGRGRNHCAEPREPGGTASTDWPPRRAFQSPTFRNDSCGIPTP